MRGGTDYTIGNTQHME